MGWRRWVAVAMCVVVALAASTACAQGDAGSGWRLDRLDLDLRVDAESEALMVSGVAMLRCEVESSPGPSLVVNTRSAFLEWVHVEPSAGEVVSMNERDASFPAARIVDIRRDSLFGEGDTMEVVFETRAVLNGNQFHVDGEYATASWVTGWTPFPKPGPGETWGAWLIRAPGTTRFDLPASWRGVTNGDRASHEVLNGRASEVWELHEPLARSFAAGPLEEAIVETGERRVAVSLLSPKPGSADNQAVTLGRAIDAMAEVFGPYPYDRFSIVEAPDQVQGFWAASEQGFILAKPGVFATEDGNLPLFAHEAAHAWWGNLVGTDGDGGIFLSESIAQYGAVLAIEQLEGREAAVEFLRFSRAGYIANQSARGYFEVIRSAQDKPLASIERGGGINHTIADSKGHWVHDMLRRRVGDEVYGETLRRLIEQYRGRDITLDAFRAAFIEVAPDAGLERFFAQWLDGTGAPALEHGWSMEDGALVIAIEQRQAEPPFELWLDVAIDWEHGETETFRAVINARSQEIRLPHVTGNVTGVRLDPEYALLLWTPEYGPAPHADPLADVAGIAPEGMAGAWAGGMDTPDGYMAGVLRVRAHDGRHSATLEFARMPGMSMPLADVEVDGESLSMRLETPGHGTLQFEGLMRDRFLLGRAVRNGAGEGVRFEFVRTVPVDALDDYAGSYTVAGRTLKIEADPTSSGGVLRVVIDGEALRWLFPVGDDLFVHGPALERPHPIEGRVQFERDDTGAVTGFVRTLSSGGESQGVRMAP